MKLHLGCGTKKLDGWVNVDSVKACQPDVVHDLSAPLPYADQSADEIMAHGVLEHFDKYARCTLMADWVRVLKVGGRLELGVPDFEKLLVKIKKFKAFDDFVDTLFGENLWESKIYIGHFGNHKWGYSKQSLRDFLKRFGIEQVKVETQGLNIYFEGKKVRHLSTDELDQMMIYSHNNNFGAETNQVTLATARAKIKEFQGQSYAKK